MVQTKSTMNLGTVIALPLKMHCKYAVDIACSENDELMYTTDAYEKQPLSW